VGQQRASMQQGGSMPNKRELRAAKLQCLVCGYRFSARVWQKGLYVQELDEPYDWVVENTEGVTCPRCGSNRLEQLKIRKRPEPRRAPPR